MLQSEIKIFDRKIKSKKYFNNFIKKIIKKITDF